MRGERALLRNILHFVRLLRRLDLPADPQRARLFAEALHHVDVGERTTFYHAARSCLIYRQQDLVDFDRAFQAFWRSHERGGIPLRLPSAARRRAFGAADAPQSGLGNFPEPGPRAGPLAYSAAEALSQKDFAELSAEELRAVEREARRLVWRLGAHPGRRRKPGSGRLPDHRRTFRSSLRYGGEPLVWELRRPRSKLRPLLLLADVSGSMQPYTRVLLPFLYGLARGLSRPPEVFVFSTRLTRITHALRAVDPQAALHSVAQAVPDWSGGTRIGEALGQFHRDWARRALGRGAVVAVISDGLDRGETDRLAVEVARLRRSCWRLLWLNPLLGSPDYRPLAQGMRAALPHIDEFLAADSLASLEELALRLQAACERRGRVTSPRRRCYSL
jgi:uncharacterized protein with von Willebrand factor type A (vWA) domain